MAGLLDRWRWNRLRPAPRRAVAERWGICPVCNLTIHRGDPLAWLRGRWVHEGCYPAPPGEVDESKARHPSRGR